MAEAAAAAAGTPEPETPADRVGDRVGAYRKQRGLKVSELARAVGVSPSLISQIERGQSRPSVSTLFALAEALAVPVDAFFAEEATLDPAPAGAAAPGATAAAAGSADAGAGAAPAGSVAPASGPTPMPAAPVAGQVAHGDAPRAGEGRATDVRYVVRHAARAAIDIEGGVRWERLTPETMPDVDFLELIYPPGAESHSELYRHPGEEMVLVLEGRLDIIVGFERYELAVGDSIHFPSTYPHRYVNPTDVEARAVTVILHDGQRPAPANGEPRRP
jgi:DNA-binding XRE family transcriptional regulator/quercetin dioxygenase-like cupin family protein